jgi:AcrR family transcriptional regulator
MAAGERPAAPPAGRAAKEVSGRHDTEVAKLRRVRREDPRIEQTRQLVLAATLELMAEHGSAAITVERIAERSGVARSTIYRRWPDLPQLYFEAFRQLRSRATHEPTGDLELDLANYIRDTAAHLNDPTYFSIVIFLMANAATSEHYARLHLELFDLASSRGAAVFRTGIEHGMVLPDADVWEAADTVRAPLVYTRLAKHERIDIDVALKAVSRIVGLYGTPAAIELLERRAAPATRSKRPPVKRSARATPASRRR